jgi:hypothetical protein
MQRRRFLLALAGLAAAPASATEFAPVLPGRRLAFPADHGAHPDFRTEWWYATGWLKLPDGSPLGFQVTFFRVRTGLGEGNPSAFAPRQLVLAHAAIADPRLGRLRHDERSARVGPGHAGFDTGTTRVWLGDWRFELAPRVTTPASRARILPTSSTCNPTARRCKGRPASAARPPTPATPATTTAAPSWRERPAPGRPPSRSPARPGWTTNGPANCCPRAPRAGTGSASTWTTAAG